MTKLELFCYSLASQLFGTGSTPLLLSSSDLLEQLVHGGVTFVWGGQLDFTEVVDLQKRNCKIVFDSGGVVLQE